MASHTPAPPPARQSPAYASAPWWSAEATETLVLLGSGLDGLSDADVAARLAADGPNRLQPRRGAGLAHELLRQFSEPIVLILLAATALALVLGDHVDAVIIFSIVLGSGLLGFWREHAASVAVARLREQVQIRVEVRRTGRVIFGAAPGRGRRRCRRVQCGGRRSVRLPAGRGHRVAGGRIGPHRRDLSAP